MRLVLLVIMLAACTDDPPALRMSVSADGVVSIALVRAPDHEFAPLSATANDIDLGAPQLFAGDEGIAFSQAPRGAVALFEVPLAQLGTSAHVVVTERDETFEADVPALGAPRTIDVLSLLMPVHAGDWIEIASGVDSDVLTGGLVIRRDDILCNTQWGTDIKAGSIAFQVAPDLQRDWYCGAPGAPGSQGAATLSLSLWPRAAMTCHGPRLECAPVELPTMNATIPITVQF